MELPTIFNETSLFDDIFGNAASGGPFYDVQETPESYILTFDMPGVSKDQVNISLQNGIISVKGTRKGRLSRFYKKSFKLPRNASDSEDRIKASLEDGVLTVEIQKTEASVAKSIKVK